MPALNISNIKDAKYGGTQLSAVYKGSTPIWTAAPDYVLTLGACRWQRNGAGGCTRGSRYEVTVTGIHNIDDPGRTYNVQYQNDFAQWIGDADRWVADPATPNVNFDFRTTFYICVSSASGGVTTRMRYKLSDGTVMDWSYGYAVLKESEDEDA